MSSEKLEHASRLLDVFEKDGPESPRAGERMVADILRACGHDVTESGFVGSGPERGQHQIDCLFKDND
jgi:hypothetical protein